MTRGQINEGLKSLGRFYHKMTLPCDDSGCVVVEGEPYERIWWNIEQVMQSFPYGGKKVLDLATFDGKFAFLAEHLGASLVIAADCNFEAHRRLLFCREALRSGIIPLFNVPMHAVFDRLDFYLQGHAVGWQPHSGGSPKEAHSDPKFDIVQHFGTFFHLRDPLQSLLQCRSVIKEGGQLILETACALDETRPVMLFNPAGENWKVYRDETTWWAPSIPFLVEALNSSLFHVEQESVRTIRFDNSIGRVALVATAVPLDQADPKIVAELKNSYRTPGLSL